MSHIGKPRCMGITHTFRDKKTGETREAQCRKKISSGVFCKNCDKRLDPRMMKARAS